jgi:beta-fructofuranosidase
LRDKTLVVWAAPDGLGQRGGSALTLDDGQGHFDGLVFGELSPGKWMAGSDFYSRTWKDQAAWPAETAGPGTFVQIAAVYQGRQVRVYRDGELYSEHTMPGTPLEFGPHPVVLLGRRHLDVTEPRNSFTGRIQDARIYSHALAEAEIRRLAPGEADPNLKPWAWWSFADEGLREKTGRFNEIKLLGAVRIEAGALVLGGNGATVIASAAGEDSVAVRAPREWSASSAVPDEVVRSTRLLRERFLADPYRPAYHFCVPEDMGQPGDPNGAFWHQGRYHLMYLYNRNGVGFCWGHISSADLVHWRHHRDAIGPGNGDEGCFSGGAFVDDDGAAYLSYWMLWGAKGIGLARGTGPFFEDWMKLDANPVIKSTEWGITEIADQAGKPLILGSADPSNIWKKDGRYFMLTGNLLVLNKYGRAADAPPEHRGDRLYLFASDDLRRWEYLNVFYDRKPEWTDPSEDNMCPSFLPLPSRPEGGPPSGKHLLLFISHNKGCQYYVGDYRDNRFHPSHHGRMTWVDSTYFAPEALVDGAGRQIMWAWLTDNPPGEKEKGWSGVFGLPRSLWLADDGTLRMAPIKELESLRGTKRSWNALELGPHGSRTLEGVAGDSCELQLEAKPALSGICGVKVRATEDDREATLLYYDAAAKQLVFDSTRGGSAGRKVVERAPFELRPGEPLRLRVFVDKSVVEVYANDRQAICRRVYPSRPDSLGIRVFASGEPAQLPNVEAWDMAPSNPF